MIKKLGYEFERVDNKGGGIRKDLGDITLYIQNGKNPAVYLEEDKIIYRMTDKSLRELIKNGGRIAIVRKK